MKVTLGRILALLMLTSTYVGLEATAANAYPGVTATGTNVVYTSDDCFNSYVTVGGLYTGADHDIEVTAPDGSYAGSDYAYGVSTEQFSTLLCTYSDPPGIYTIRVDGAVAGSFSVTQPAFRVSRLNKRTVRSALSLNGAPMTGSEVHVQISYRGSWIDSLKMRTNANGAASVYCKKHHRCPQYFRFAYDDFVYSSSFKLYTGRKNGREIATSSPAGALASSVG